MQSVRFVNGTRAGFRYYTRNMVAGISDSEAARLVAAGEVELISPAVPSEPEPEAPPDPPESVDDEPPDEAAEAAPSILRAIRKPARRRRRKG